MNHVAETFKLITDAQVGDFQLRSKNSEKAVKFMDVISQFYKNHSIFVKKFTEFL